jgi:hypothetical protein
MSAKLAKRVRNVATVIVAQARVSRPNAAAATPRAVRAHGVRARR